MRWNHNIHYFPVLLDAVPLGARRALDVGCGEGMLCRLLRERADHVVGIDLDADQIELARATTSTETGRNVTYVCDDVMTHSFDGSFDAVVSVATLHHLPTKPALSRLAELVAPGGVLAIEGVARSTTPLDFVHDLGGAVATRVLKHTGGRQYFEHSAPIVWPPADSFGDIRRISADLLPGVQYRRHVLWRYTLVWTKPTA